jgi:TPR repeat
MHTLRVLACALAIAAPTARAAGPAVNGEYESPLGRVRIVGNGTSFHGVLVVASDLCAFKEGEEVLRTTLLDDSLAGQVRVCLAGKGCKAREEWSSAVLLASADRLSGAVHVAAKGCKAPLGKNGGVAFVRVEAPADAVAVAAVHPEPFDSGAAARPLRSGQAESKGAEASARSRRGAAEPVPDAAPRVRRPARPAEETVRAQAKEILRDGAAWLREGNFEAARRRFLESIEIDAAVPEAYNGVGVTYRMRNDFSRALEWYKKAVAVDPDFGDAYYNMACVYALEGQKEMALRYLQIAALNGYATAEGIDGDPDLESVRNEPGYHALVRTKM